MPDREKVIKTLTDALTAKENYPWAKAEMSFEFIEMLLELLKEQETMMQCIKGKCRICPHCANCDVDENGLLKEQEVKTGKWIEQIDYLGDTYYDCSVCNESWMTIEGTPWVNGMNYCPHCGAKMEGR